jgi:putative ABC transport system permease protein
VGVYLQIAMRNLVQARRRTAMLGGALAAVTMLLVMLLALSAGLRDTLIQNATTLSAGHINVAGFFKAKARDSAPIVTGLSELRRVVEAETPDLDYVIDRQRGWGKLISDTSSMNVGMAGIDIDEEPQLLAQLQLASTSEYQTDGDDEVLGDFSELALPNTAMLFASQARRLEVGVGDMLTITTETMDGRSNTGEVRVIAVAKDAGMMTNWRLFVPKQTILELYQLKPDTTGAVMVYLKDVEKAPEVMNHLRERLQDAGYEIMSHEPQPFFMKMERVSGEDWTGQKLDLTIWSDEVSYLMWIITGLDTISFILVTILLLIIGVGIMNTMWIAVRERTQELGTLRAIGMGRRRVLQMILLEASLLGFASTVLGACLGALFAYGLDASAIVIPDGAVRYILLSDRLHLLVEVGDVVKAIAVFTALTAIAAIGPALRAAKLQPITAIHSIQ